jgi:hypothetical protein
VAQHLVDAAAWSIQLGLRNLLRDQVLTLQHQSAQSHTSKEKWGGGSVLSGVPDNLRCDAIRAPFASVAVKLPHETTMRAASGFGCTNVNLEATMTL